MNSQSDPQKHNHDDHESSIYLRLPRRLQTHKKVSCTIFITVESYHVGVK